MSQRATRASCRSPAGSREVDRGQARAWLPSILGVELVLLGSLDDPFDRMIVSAARATKRPLLTGDARIAESGLVDVVWD